METPTQKNILGLQLPTDPRWVDLAAISLEAILTDHAWCEQKAATSCISLITRYSEKERLVEELSPIVTEEWGHFRLVLAELQKRGLPLGRQRKDVYVNQLMEFQQKGGNEEERLLDRLLIFALIEARSCERFKRLSEGLEDAYLRQFYRRFMESGTLSPFYRAGRNLYRQRQRPAAMEGMAGSRSRNYGDDGSEGG
jgi:tRNA-(ms[2]io[6]A)-hydroxylase